MNREDYPRIAREVAQIALEGVPDQYARFVSENLYYYAEPPEEGDFLAWLDEWAMRAE